MNQTLPGLDFIDDPLNELLGGSPDELLNMLLGGSPGQLLGLETMLPELAFGNFSMGGGNPDKLALLQAMKEQFNVGTPRASAKPSGKEERPAKRGSQERDKGSTSEKKSRKAETKRKGPPGTADRLDKGSSGRNAKKSDRGGEGRREKKEAKKSSSSRLADRIDKDSESDYYERLKSGNFRLG